MSHEAFQNAAASLSTQQRAVVREVGDGLRQGQRRPLRVLAAAGSGKCVVGSTLVTLPSGVVRIDEAQGATEVYGTVNADTLEYTMRARASWFALGLSRTIKITTATGIEIEGTPEHPLLVWGATGPEWIRLDQMTAGHHVLLRPGYAIGSGTPFVDPEEAYLVGLFMGDGCRSNGDAEKGLAFTKDDLVVGDVYKALAEKYWGHKVVRYDYPKKATRYVINSADVARTISARFPGLVCASARQKFVPPKILGATDTERVEFLRGLFDTDGSAGPRAVEWLSASERLAREVHQMLLGLGVVGRLKPKLVKGQSQNVENHTYWRILISGEHARTFAERVGFKHSAHKAAALSDSINAPSNPNEGCYPHVKDALKFVRDSHWKPQGRWNGHNTTLDDVRVNDYLNGKRRPSRARLLKFVDGCESTVADRLRRLTDYFPDEVVGMEHSDEEKPVYDFTVPGTSSFIANGIVSHNTKTLITTIAAVVLSDLIPANEIVGTTFTRVGAEVMRDRLAGLLGPTLVQGTDIGTGRKNKSGVELSTYHSIAIRRILRFQRTDRTLQRPHGWNFATNLDASSKERWGTAQKEPPPGLTPDAVKTVTNIELEDLWERIVSRGEIPGLPQGTPSLRQFMEKRPGANLDTPDPKEVANAVEVFRAWGATKPEEVGPKSGGKLSIDDAVAYCWRLFNQIKKNLNAWDFADALQAYADCVAKGGDRCRLLFVDESQDNSPLQMQIARDLVRNHPQGRVCYIGDIRQAIYAFRGADPSILGNADKPVSEGGENAITLELSTNYRSGSDIVEAGNRAVDGEDWMVGAPALAARPSKGSVEYVAATGPVARARAIAVDIAGYVREGQAQPKDFAVLSRKRSALGPLEIFFLAHNIPIKIQGGSPFFKIKVINRIMRLVRLGMGAGDETSMRADFRGIVSDFVGRAKRDAVDKVWADNVKGPKAVFEGLSDWYDEETRKRYGRDLLWSRDSDEQEKRETGFDLVLKGIEAVVKGDAERRPAKAILVEVVKILIEAGLATVPDLEKLAEGAAPAGPGPEGAETPTQPEADKQAGADSGEETDREMVGALLEVAAELSLDDLSRLSLRGLQAKDKAEDERASPEEVAKAEADEKNRVIAGTIHSAKGAEYKTVFLLAGANDIPANAKADPAEELRIFYVGITRAEDRLVLISDGGWSPYVARIRPPEEDDDAPAPVPTTPVTPTTDVDDEPESGETAREPEPTSEPMVHHEPEPRLSRLELDYLEVRKLVVAQYPAYVEVFDRLRTDMLRVMAEVKREFEAQAQAPDLVRDQGPDSNPDPDSDKIRRAFVSDAPNTSAADDMRVRTWIKIALEAMNEEPDAAYRFQIVDLKPGLVRKSDGKRYHATIGTRLVDGRVGAHVGGVGPAPTPHVYGFVERPEDAVALVAKLSGGTPGRPGVPETPVPGPGPKPTRTGDSELTDAQIVLLKGIVTSEYNSDDMKTMEESAAAGRSVAWVWSFSAGRNLDPKSVGGVVAQAQKAGLVAVQRDHTNDESVALTPKGFYAIRPYLDAPPQAPQAPQAPQVPTSAPSTPSAPVPMRELPGTCFVQLRRPIESLGGEVKTIGVALAATPTLLSGTPIVCQRDRAFTIGFAHESSPNGLVVRDEWNNEVSDKKSPLDPLKRTLPLLDELTEKFVNSPSIPSVVRGDPDVLLLWTITLGRPFELIGSNFTGANTFSAGTMLSRVEKAVRSGMVHQTQRFTPATKQTPEVKARWEWRIEAE